VTDSWLSPPEPVVPLSQLPPQPGRPRTKVLHVITRFEAGAGGNTLLSAMGMDPERYDMWIAGCDGGPLWERAERTGIHTVRLRRLRHEISPVNDAAVLLELVRLIRRERFAIVHAHSAKGGFLGRLAAWLCRVPVVLYTLHGRDPWWPGGPAASAEPMAGLMAPTRRRSFLALERSLRSVTDGFIAVAPQVARDAIEGRIARAGSVAVAPSAIDLDSIPMDPDPTVRTEFEIPLGVPVVGMVGRLDEQKAPLDFVRMAAIVQGRRPDARFIVVGAGRLEDRVREEVRRSGLNALITGFRSDAPRIASTFDVFVVSSLYEGVGRSVTEALASARPVVATAVDGIVDLIRPGGNGLLAPAGDPEALAACVLWLLDHPEDARRMGEQGRAYVRLLFEPAQMCATLDRVYSRFLGSEPKSRPHEIASRGPSGAGSIPVPNGSGSGSSSAPASRIGASELAHG
jgi:glycosyltransferase involved in cell wall biosynthesis